MLLFAEGPYQPQSPHLLMGIIKPTLWDGKIIDDMLTVVTGTEEVLVVIIL